jgi:porin
MLPDGEGMGPASVSAKPAHPARHRATGSGYGEMRFVPASEPSSTTQEAPAAPQANQPVAPAASTESKPVTSEPPMGPPASPSPAELLPATKPVSEPATKETSDATPPAAAPAAQPTAIASVQPADMAHPTDETAHISATTTESSTTTAAEDGKHAEGSSGDAATAAEDADAHLTDHWLSGPRGKLEDRGVIIDAQLATYFGTNFTGGAKTGQGGASYKFNLNVTLDSKKIAGYDGGTVFVNLRTQDGLEHSMDGAFSSTSNLYEPQLTTVSEFWYQQLFFGDKLRVKFGKIDANADFALVQNGGEFLNGFASFSSTIESFPTDPDPALAALAFYNFNDHFYAGVGIFDGSLEQGVATGGLGTNTPFRSSFIIAEAGTKWAFPAGRAGRLAIGYWQHTGSIGHLDNSGHDTSTGGPYATFDQTLWRLNPDKDDDQRGIAMFAIAGYANPRNSLAEEQFSVGAKWTGLLPSRPDDIVGLGVNYDLLSQAANSGFDKDAETAVEAFYKIQIKPYMSIEPDLQYISNPGGTSSQRNALVGTVQLLVDF